MGVRFRTTGKEGKRKGGHTLSAGEASDEELETAAPLPCRRRLQRRRPTAERVSETRGERGGTTAWLQEVAACPRHSLHGAALGGGEEDDRGAGLGWARPGGRWASPWAPCKPLFFCFLFIFLPFVCLS